MGTPQMHVQLNPVLLEPQEFCLGEVFLSLNREVSRHFDDGEFAVCVYVDFKSIIPGSFVPVP